MHMADKNPSAIDMGVYDKDRLFRVPNAAKCPEAPMWTAVPLLLITQNPWDGEDRLSVAAVDDPDLKAAVRSLVTVLDTATSTLIPDRYKTAKRKSVGGAGGGAGGGDAMRSRGFAGASVAVNSSTPNHTLHLKS